MLLIFQLIKPAHRLPSSVAMEVVLTLVGGVTSMMIVEINQTKWTAVIILKINLFPQQEEIQIIRNKQNTRVNSAVLMYLYDYIILSNFQSLFLI